MSSEKKVSYDLKRFAGIKRDYTPEEVERLRGSIKIEYSMCKNQSEKLWELLNTENYVNTLGSLSGNHADILKADKQISPLSGSIKKQVVSLIGDEQILLNGNLFSTSKYTIKSKNENLSDDKKLNFEIWIDKTSKIIVKVAYNRLGNWEYRMKKAN